jgi:hypothetical protein
MPKLLRQNVGGTDYSMVGCALTATCATPATTAAKVATLTDGDVLADGMSVAVQFTNGNTAASPLTLTVGGVTANICDSRGQNIGGNIWQAGNVVTFLYTFGKFLLLNCIVDEVTLNNMNSVSSNAVAQYGANSMIPMLPQAQANPLLYLDSLSYIGIGRHAQFRLINTHTFGSPYGDDADTDFFYDARMLDGGAWGRVVAYDIRSNRQYYIEKNNGVWGYWSSYVNFHPEGNYINGGQAKLYAARTENMVQLSIDAYSGTTGIPAATATHIATISPVPLIITQLTIRTDATGGYARAWLDIAGRLWIYISYADYVGNLAIGGTYICP